MTDYPTLHLKSQIKVKELCLYCCSTFHSNEHIKIDFAAIKFLSILDQYISSLEHFLCIALA